MTDEKECPNCKSDNVKLIHMDKPEYRHFRCVVCGHIFSGVTELDNRCIDCAYTYRSPECRESIKQFSYQCGLHKAKGGDNNKMKHLVEIGKERKGMNLYMCSNCNALHGYVGVEVEYPNNLCYVCKKYTTHKLVFLSGQQ